MRTLFFLLLIVVCLCGAPGTGKAAADQDFAPFGLEELMKTLEHAKGKVVLINFFATWCPPCKEEIPHLMGIRKGIPEDKLVLIGVSVDEDIQELRKFAMKTRFNYPVYTGQGDLLAALELSAIPHMIIVDREGALCYSQPGLLPEALLRHNLNQLVEGQKAAICAETF